MQLGYILLLWSKDLLSEKYHGFLAVLYQIIFECYNIIHLSPSVNIFILQIVTERLRCFNNTFSDWVHLENFKIIRPEINGCYSYVWTSSIPAIFTTVWCSKFITRTIFSFENSVLLKVILCSIGIGTCSVNTDLRCGDEILWEQHKQQLRVLAVVR